MDVQKIITQQAEAAGVDPEIALSIAQAESSLNPNAKSKHSSAAGLFQVLKGTWGEYGGAPNKRTDPLENARVGVAIIKDNAQAMQRALGRDPSATEVYAAHVFGKTGGRKLLQASEDTPVAKVLSKQVIGANKLHGKTVGDVMAWLEKKVPSSVSQPAAPVQQAQSGAARATDQEPVVAPPAAADVPFQLGPKPELLARATQSTPRMRDITAPTGNPTDNYDAVALTAALGPSYQAALGAMALADSDESEDPDVGGLSIAERTVAQGPDAYAQIAQADLATKPVLSFAEGGSVDDPEAAVFEEPGIQTGTTAAEMLKGLGQTGYGLAKGATQALAGMPGDIELFGRILAGQEDPDTIFPTTDDAKKFLDKVMPSAGDAVPGTEGRSPAEYFGEWMDITGLAKPAVRGVQKAAKAAGKLATSEPAYRMLERITEPTRSYAIRPPGGVMPTSGAIFDGAMSNLDDMLNDAGNQVYRLGVSHEQERAIMDFLDTKARNYFSKNLASTKDPIYDYLKEGRIKPLSADEQRFREYMLNAAREGDPAALEDLAKAYDRQLMGGLYGGDFAAQGTAADQLRALTEQANKNLAPQEIGKMDITDWSKYRSKREFREQMEQGTAPQPWQMAAQKGEPMYDIEQYSVPYFMRPTELVPELAEIPPEKLSKMSYPEAVAAANKNMRFKSDFQASVDRVKQGKDVPKQVMLFGTKPYLTNPDGRTWVRLTDSHAALMEGTSMGHSVGGYHTSAESYNLGGRKAFNEGRAQIFSLRNDKGIPSVTIEGLSTPQGLEITQIQGPRNEMPSAQGIEDVFNFIDNTPSIIRLPSQTYWHDTGSMNWTQAYRAWKFGE